MGFLDILRKLGILRSGAVKATYTNATERPIELQEEGVFNAEKDLVTPPEVTEKKPEPSKKKKAVKKGKKKPAKKSGKK
ncbi:MAG: hypothetical protein HGA85_07950 [Nanoarchaeota archaeon]|nr:hypothetical protein [Nanoarchaeota archaeon]